MQDIRLNYAACTLPTGEWPSGYVDRDWDNQVNGNTSPHSIVTVLR